MDTPSRRRNPRISWVLLRYRGVGQFDCAVVLSSIYQRHGACDGFDRHAIRALKSDAKARKYSDEKGLFLLVTPTGSKLWRLKYRFDGKEKLLAFGIHPDVGLKTARERRDEARQLLANVVDSSEHRKENKAARAEAVANSFEVVAREWFAKQVASWRQTHADKIVQRLEKDVFPWLGGKPIAAIGAQEVYDKKGGEMEFIVIETSFTGPSGMLVARSRQIVLVRNAARSH